MAEPGSDLILSIDCGTTSCRASLWNPDRRMVSIATGVVPRLYPAPGHVEQDPAALWRIQLETVRKAISRIDAKPRDIVSAGITNQRETVVAWDSETGRPLNNAISWLDQRDTGFETPTDPAIMNEIKRKTGLVFDPYFSAMKMHWIVAKIRSRFGRRRLQNLKLGTVDSWLLWNLTGKRAHITDWSNASRTMLFDIRRGEWDGGLLDLFSVEPETLPEIVDSIGSAGQIDASLLGVEVPIEGIAGDQQASLFGHVSLHRGDLKNTYGTGSFLLLNAGKEVPQTKNLISTVAWKERGNRPVYAVEGSEFNTGSMLDWIRDALKLMRSTPRTEYIARKASSDHGVYFVPALTGLGAPYWNRSVRGTLFGVSPTVSRSDIVRAALESIAFRIRDMVDSLKAETGISPATISVDGKPADNNFLLQFQADILGMPVERYANPEVTSAGAAYMAGLAHGIYTKAQLERSRSIDRVFEPEMSRKDAEMRYAGWKKAVRAAISFS